MSDKKERMGEYLDERARAPAIRWLREPTFDQDGVQASSGLTAAGEYPDPVPMAPPIGLSVHQGDPLRESMRRVFQEERAAFMAAVDAEGFESEEEANDFYVADDMFPADPGLPWEGPFDFTEAQEATEKAARAEKRSEGGIRPPEGSGATGEPAKPASPPAPEARASSDPKGV